MSLEIIDFHTHPFNGISTNICQHDEFCDMSPENTKNLYNQLGISKICGSVITRPWGQDKDISLWDKIKENNNIALQLREFYGDFYIPGFHVHPDYIKESCEEIERMHRLGINLVGELVPYLDGWKDYDCKGFSEILDVIEQYNMVVSLHTMGNDQMDQMIKQHPNITFVAAHPGEYGDFMRHLERMKLDENYYLDLSGTGLFRHGMLRHAVNLFGAERILFGSDYPTCNPAMFLGGVLLEPLLNDNEKEKILSLNAKRLLNL